MKLFDRHFASVETSQTSMSKTTPTVHVVKVPEPRTNFEATSIAGLDYKDTEPQSMLRRLSNNILGIEFGQTSQTKHGLLIIPLILIVLLANAQMVLMPKYDANELDYYEVLSQEIFHVFFVNVISIAQHQFDYRLIMGKSAACAGKNLIFLFLCIFGLTFNYRWSSIIFKIRCLFPANLNQIIISFLSRIILYIIFWFQHPKSERLDSGFRRRFMWYILYKLQSNVVFVVFYTQTEGLFERITNHFQIALSFVLIGIRYICKKLMDKTVEKARGNDELSARFAVNATVGSRHALYLIIIIGSKARFETSMVYMFLDTFLILKGFFKTLSSVNNQDGRRLSLDMNRFDEPWRPVTLKETCEILIPACFIPVYAMAFFGPNKEIFGLFKDIELNEFLDSLQKMGYVLVFDGIRIVVFASILKFKFRISLFQCYTKLMRTYWKYLAAIISQFLFLVSDIKI